MGAQRSDHVGPSGCGKVLGFALNMMERVKGYCYRRTHFANTKLPVCFKIIKRWKVDSKKGILWWDWGWCWRLLSSPKSGEFEMGSLRSWQARGSSVQETSRKTSEPWSEWPALWGNTAQKSRLHLGAETGFLMDFTGTLGDKNYLLLYPMHLIWSGRRGDGLLWYH